MHRFCNPDRSVHVTHEPLLIVRVWKKALVCINTNMCKLPDNFNDLSNTTKVELKCSSCELPYLRLVRDIKTSIRNNKFRYLCKNCAKLKTGVYKNCELCKKEFYVTNYNMTAKFCSSSCSAKINNSKRSLKNKATYITKECDYCSTSFIKNVHLIKKQRYCSMSCSTAHRRDQYWSPIKEAIERGEVKIRDNIESNNGIFKKYLIEKYGAKCMRCSWAEINPYTNKIPIELEHKDGDCTNNNLSNLELLCPNCHSLTSTYKGANKRVGGSARYNVWKTYFNNF